MAYPAIFALAPAAGVVSSLPAAAQLGGLQPLLALPVIAGFLFALGVLLIVGEFLTAQFTGLGLAGAGLLALVAWGQSSAGMINWWGVTLLALGVALLAVEVLALPGFGVAGLLGLGALGGSLFLLASGGVALSPADPGRGLSAVGAAVLGLVAGGGAQLWWLPHFVARRGLVLHATVESLAPAFALPALDEPFVAPPHSLEGAIGEALSDLRPSGYALIGDRRIDVITRGELIPRAARVQVIADEGYRRVVRQLAPEEYPLER